MRSLVRKLHRSGGSICVTIPVSYLEKNQLNADSQVFVQERDGQLIISPPAVSPITLLSDTELINELKRRKTN